MAVEFTANRVRGMATGAMFFAGFGAGWLFLALIARQEIDGAMAPAVGTLMLALFATAAYVMRQAKKLPRMPDDPKTGRAFGIVNAVQWAAVGVVAFTFSRFGIDAYVISAITAIVGLHLFPLARLFRNRLHYATGSVLVVWAAASVFLFSKDAMQGSTAMGTGAILWAAAAVTLMLAMRAVRREAGAVELQGGV